MIQDFHQHLEISLQYLILILEAQKEYQDINIIHLINILIKFLVVMHIHVKIFYLKVC